MLTAEVKASTRESSEWDPMGRRRSLLALGLAVRFGKPEQSCESAKVDGPELAKSLDGSFFQGGSESWDSGSVCLAVLMT